MVYRSSSANSGYGTLYGDVVAGWFSGVVVLTQAMGHCMEM